MTTSNKYLYGVIREPEVKTFEIHGVDDAPVYTLNFHDLAAVVSDIESAEIDPTRKNVMAHTLVQDAILKQYSVIPMGFGIIAACQSNVSGLLEKNYTGLVNELNKLADKVEVEVKIFWDDKALVMVNQPLVNKLQSQVKAASNTIDAQRRMSEAGMQVEKIVLAMKSKCADQIYTSLQKLARDSRLNACSGVKMLLNASFLIDRKTETDFIDLVRNLDTKFQGQFNFKYIGPLSPYNFVSLKLELVI